MSNLIVRSEYCSDFTLRVFFVDWLDQSWLWTVCCILCKKVLTKILRIGGALALAFRWFSWFRHHLALFWWGNATKPPSRTWTYRQSAGTRLCSLVPALWRYVQVKPPTHPHPPKDLNIPPVLGRDCICSRPSTLAVYLSPWGRLCSVFYLFILFIFFQPWERFPN